MKSKSLKFSLIFLSIFATEIFCQTFAFNKSIAGFFTGGQITLDLYKSYSSLYFDFRRYDRSFAIQGGQEKLIYNKLLSEIAMPKFLLLQHTFYPLTSLSSYLETEKPHIFDRFDTIYNVNLLRVLSGGYEEPFAWTIFAGNILFMRYQFIENGELLRRKQAGSALAGFAYSLGHHQILDNVYIHDFWQQVEFVLVGTINEKKQRKLSWNFRLGIKFHRSGRLNNVLTLQFERNHTLYHWDKFSFLKNSLLRYKAYFPLDDKNHPPHSVYQYLIYGKKFPLKVFGKKVFLVLASGVEWEWTYRYNQEQNKFASKPEGFFTWVFSPNVEF